MHRYYLGGQSILAVNADEKSWLVSDVAQTTRLFDPLRRSESMLLLRLTREFRQQSSAAVDMLQQFGQLCFDLNLGMLQGALRSDPLGCSLCKHQLSCLHDTASACVCVWLVRRRGPLDNWNLYPVDANEVQQATTADNGIGGS